MEEKSQRSQRKRPFMEDDDSDKPSMSKRVRFPKGKKVKPGEEAVASRQQTEDDNVPGILKEARFAAKERANRRNQITAELFSEENSRGILNDVSVSEVTYQDNEDFIEEGVQIEPFNLNKEREEGYFDADGNFVEYVSEKEIKDAWLDSIESVPKYAGKVSIKTNNEHYDENAVDELSSEDIALIKRRIANLLEPGETVLQALRRLKGTSSKRKEKMPAETEHLFNQLTEDAMKLMENGDYNVYDEKQDVFEREAEGYETLARAKGVELLSDMINPGLASFVPPDSTITTSNTIAPATEISSSDAYAYDIFADDDEHATAKPSADMSDVISSGNTNAVSQSSSSAVNTIYDNGELQNDYVYDDSSGYYFSSNLGYYYDPSTGLYCSATSGLWYVFHEETGTYEEIHEAASDVN
ncbi:hypothetical protein CFOL_v3_08887 [Cephalotus follicularis]|uniref:OCRE domain-containing protein n=1 Tax=Cephalotus follicularis TaxID=3775 RepID=A0A1Q3BC36_CEPFO|nr:hypothetical protein CFOL_v3_08887 [Cephalotus follicularis]